MPMGRRRQTDLHLPPRMRLKGGRYYYDHGGKPRVWTPLSRDLAEARTMWAKIENDALPAPADSFQAVIDRYVREVVPLKAPRTGREYTRQAGTIGRVFGAMPIKAVRPTHIAQYLDSHRSPVSANREKSLVSAMFSQAMRWGWCDSNPCKGVRRNTEKPRDRFITDAEFAALYAAATPLVQCVMDIAYQTGMRKADILGIKLADIREDGIYVRQGKTGKQQLFELSPDLREVIGRAKGLRKQAFSQYLFPGRLGAACTTTGFDTAWKRLTKKVGIKDLHFHDIRARAVTDAKAQGQDAQAFAGHRTSAQTETYLRNKEVVKVVPIRRK